jgi:hypothetical protein
MLAPVSPFAMKVLSTAFGPVLAAGSGLLLVAAQTAVDTATEGNVLTLIASVLASTGVVGYAVKRFVDSQVARAAAAREEDKEEKRQAQMTHDRLVASFETQMGHWQGLYKEERARNDALVSTLTQRPPLTLDKRA